MVRSRRFGGGANRLPFSRGISRLFGPAPETVDVMRRVAIARGLSNVDQLLALLGKEAHEVSSDEAYALLEKERGLEAVVDARMANYYSGKGDRNCDNLLERYLKRVKESDSDRMAINLRKLKKYCGYTNEELRALH